MEEGRLESKMCEMPEWEYKSHKEEELSDERLEGSKRLVLRKNDIEEAIIVRSAYFCTTIIELLQS